MTATSRPTESSAASPMLYVAFELGGPKWVLASAPGIGLRCRLRARPARECRRCRRKPAQAKRRFGLTLRRRYGVVTKRAAMAFGCTVAARAGWRSGGGFLEHRSQSAGAAGEDGSFGCAEVGGAAAAMAPESGRCGASSMCRRRRPKPTGS